MRRRRVRERQPILFGSPVPSFASTPDEIRRAVEKGAILRGTLLIKVIASLDIEGLLEIVKVISGTFDKEDFHERHGELGIDVEALSLLDSNDPPIPYPYYFCDPNYLIRYPPLMMYYRNVAMLSRKVMHGIGLDTLPYEDRGVVPSQQIALELSRYFNSIVCKMIKISGVTPYRHLEMVLSNIGDSLGGVSRNEIGRAASAHVIRYLISHWFKLGYLESIAYALKDNYEFDDDEQETKEVNVETGLLSVSPDVDIEAFLDRVESRRVKYQELTLRNGYRLLLDKQITWYDSNNKFYKIGPDLYSRSVEVDMVWAGEIKGGADPAGSDEHWKTATQALTRIIDAADVTGRLKPKLSFMATILVDRVAIEAQQWVNEGILTSVYNLTRVLDSEEDLRKFLSDMTGFVGY